MKLLLVLKTLYRNEYTVGVQDLYIEGWLLSVYLRDDGLKTERTSA